MKIVKTKRIFRDKGTYDDSHLYKRKGLFKTKSKNVDPLFDNSFIITQPSTAGSQMLVVRNQNKTWDSSDANGFEDIVCLKNKLIEDNVITQASTAGSQVSVVRSQNKTWDSSDANVFEEIVCLKNKLIEDYPIDRHELAPAINDSGLLTNETQIPKPAIYINNHQKEKGSGNPVLRGRFREQPSYLSLADLSQFDDPAPQTSFKIIQGSSTEANIGTISSHHASDQTSFSHKGISVSELHTIMPTTQQLADITSGRVQNAFTDTMKSQSPYKGANDVIHQIYQADNARSGINIDERKTAQHQAMGPAGHVSIKPTDNHSTHALGKPTDSRSTFDHAPIKPTDSRDKLRETERSHDEKTRQLSARKRFDRLLSNVTVAAAGLLLVTALVAVVIWIAGIV